MNGKFQKNPCNPIEVFYLPIRFIDDERGTDLKIQC